VTAAALLLAPVACGVVLLMSGWAKRGDTSGTRMAFAAMGVPRALSRRTIVEGLPYAELALGALLLVTWGWVLAVVAVAVTALFVVYTALVARVLLAGAEVECHCFGGIGGDRITTATFARNVLLVVLGVLAIGFGTGGSGVMPALRDLDGAEWWWPVMTALVVATAVLVTARHDAPETAVDEDEADYVRQPIPVGLLVREDGNRVNLRELAQFRPQLLVFMSTACYSCDVVAEWLPGFAERLRPVQINTVFSVDLDRVPDHLRPVGATPLHDPGQVVTDLFTNGRPAAVLLGADGYLAGGPVIGGHEVEGFVDDIVAELADAPVVAVPPDFGHGHGHGHDHDHDASA
jgi:hypothetical protein